MPTRPQTGADPKPGDGKALDASWQAWTRENLARACDAAGIVEILRTNGFGLSSIRETMGAAFPGGAPVAVAPPPPVVPHAALAASRITRPESGAVRIESDRLQLYRLEGFASDAECDALVAIIRKHLRPSTITLDSADKQFRTSSTCDLSNSYGALVRTLDERISKALGISLAYSEPIQAQMYKVGQQFKAHTDFFEPHTPEYDTYAARTGNRTWTFMVYLNTTAKGGATDFVAIDHSIAPLKGTAVIWNNLYPDGQVNRDTLHSGTPIIEGEKIIITKWFREHGPGPMFAA